MFGLLLQPVALLLQEIRIYEMHCFVQCYSRKCAHVLAEAGILATLIPDSAIGYAMEKADMVIVGAEGVVENGGIVNKIGTFTCAMVAKAMNKPFYVAAESYKFARLYPLNQRDFPEELYGNQVEESACDCSLSVEHKNVKVRYIGSLSDAKLSAIA